LGDWDWDWDWDARRALGLLLPTVGAGTHAMQMQILDEQQPHEQERRAGERGKSRGREKRGERGWDSGEEVVGQQRAGNVAGAELKGDESFRQACADKCADWPCSGLPPRPWAPMR
jgi:hypothetical protein